MEKECRLHIPTFANNHNGYVHIIILAIQTTKNHIQYETFSMKNKAA
jgi:hypothetical protein